MEKLRVITAKDLANTMGISIKTAQKYLQDVKKEYEIKLVLGDHVNRYFKVNATSGKN
ncbi:hypothetical protein ACHRVK_19325 [Flavobacterium plurextorum]|uniref:hypothetical protein n=1 Tax=Flavobacterium plurextorum TaxID=1114867 RepID=UPI003757DA7A